MNKKSSTAGAPFLCGLIGSGVNIASSVLILIASILYVDAVGILLIGPLKTFAIIMFVIAGFIFVGGVLYLIMNLISKNKNSRGVSFGSVYLIYSTFTFVMGIVGILVFAIPEFLGVNSSNDEAKVIFTLYLVGAIVLVVGAGVGMVSAILFINKINSEPVPGFFSKMQVDQIVAQEIARWDASHVDDRKGRDMKVVQQPGSPCVVCISGMYRNATFPVRDNEELVIGRDSSVASIVVDEGADRVSRKHCGIRYSQANGTYTVTDFSLNGTFREDGSRLANKVPTTVPRGTIINLGSRQNSFRLD